MITFNHYKTRHVFIVYCGDVDRWDLEGKIRNHYFSEDVEVYSIGHLNYKTGYALRVELESYDDINSTIMSEQLSTLFYNLNIKGLKGL